MEVIKWVMFPAVMAVTAPAVVIDRATNTHSVAHRVNKPFAKAAGWIQNTCLPNSKKAEIVARRAIR